MKVEGWDKYEKMVEAYWLCYYWYWFIAGVFLFCLYEFLVHHEGCFAKNIKEVTGAGNGRTGDVIAIFIGAGHWAEYWLGRRSASVRP